MKIKEFNKAVSDAKASEAKPEVKKSNHLSVLK
jgi:hypothetical protein